MALHTFHSDKSKEAFQARNLGNTSTQREWAEAWTFEKCQCVATWVGDDDFFFCHWEAETQDDILAQLEELGLDNLIQTACYEMHRFTSAFRDSDELRQFPPMD